jgi:DNA-binding MarR family transcriptional regulator
MTLLEAYEEARADIRQTGKTLTEKARLATEQSLSPMEILTLVTIHKLQPATCTEIAASLGVTLPQVTALNKALETYGLTLPPIPAPKPDRRIRYLKTTNKGGQLAARIEAL